MPEIPAYTYTAGVDEPDGATDNAYLSCLLRQEHCRDLYLVQRLATSGSPPDADPVTLEVDCELYTAIAPGDELAIRVQPREVQDGQLEFTFDHVRLLPGGGEELVARGSQRIAYRRPGAGAAVGSPPVPLVPDHEPLPPTVPHGTTHAGRPA
ncbi:hypothetical protein DSC45_35115 [Streptomyces sp. YIM 130001]|uniref:acyl-CoA thioesterase n=1 Tax=Streptomyces sp. YIM 130001 TaxID=2259644 RepID=UPI000E64880F|nr:acyl-CoA thioesterase [Streptomyces sp. YIM 130001]RII06879.1 hypothetical protein DSC45_35115 [Streptomyces sp. YIM 130001]